MANPPALDFAIEHLAKLVSEAPERLNRVPGTSATLRPEVGKWSKKEILGHLIDSAVNNLQRFVRLQQEAALRFPPYDQERWVGIQRHRTRQWSDLVTEWWALNQHILHILSNVDPMTLDHVWIDGDNATFKFLIGDYVAHLRHHLDQIAPDTSLADGD